MGELRTAPVFAAAVTAGVAASAHAGNASHSPTPVVWENAACMTVVDRERDPIVEFGYTIPFEDTEVTTDEVDDSRTHQFFALCESTGWFVFLPPWVSSADVTVADARGLVEAETLDTEAVLETSARWGSCWTRITADDERRPITFEAAERTVRWDTTELPTGVYVVEGYTHEPPKNQWRTRPGVFKVVDGTEDDGAGPAVAITTEEAIVFANESVLIEGCVDATEGATMTLAWAAIDRTLAWADFMDPQPVSGGSFAIPFDPPMGAAGTTVAIRVTVEDASGRSNFAYMLEPLIVLAEDAPPGQGESGSGSSGSSSDGAALDDGDAPRSCACSTDDGWSSAWLMLPLVAVRRRRRARTG